MIEDEEEAGAPKLHTEIICGREVMRCSGWDLQDTLDLTFYDVEGIGPWPSGPIVGVKRVKELA